MNNFKKVLLFLTAGLLLSSCTLESVQVGNVGLKVHLYGSDKGLQKDELQPGRYFCSINEDVIEFPVFEQNYIYKNDQVLEFQSIEGNVVKADIGIITCY